MDNRIPTMLPPEESADFPGYSPYPDAGDPFLLSTDIRPDFHIPIPVPHAPSVLPASPPPSTLSEPECVINSTSVKSHPGKNKPSTPIGFRKIIAGAFALFALLVYGGFMAVEGMELLSEGLGKLAVGGYFGFTKQVETLPVTPMPESNPPVPGETILSPLPETSPPAREEPTPPPANHVENRDLSSRAQNGLGLINETPYTPDLAALAATEPVIDNYASLESIYGKDTPAVLILHTHGTEAFANRAAENYHTTDKTENICAVGEALADTLRKAGIGVLHCTDLFDEEAYDLSYYNAAAYIRETLSANPSIRYILDIHRDAITMENGTGIRPLSLVKSADESSDTTYAQLMFVVGTDHGGSGHTSWETNLALAARLQSGLHGINPTLMRDINLRSASFNAQYAPGALLVEAGAACSTLEEAKRSIEVFGEVLAAEILGQ